MRATILFLFIALLTTSVDAVTYQKLDGSIVTLQYRADSPVFGWPGGVVDHPYSGDNLEPGATILGNPGMSYLDDHLTLYDADLRDADLRNVTGEYWVVLGGADLTGANLSNASLAYLYGDTTFVNADLSDADLSWAWINASDLTNANLTNANLSNVVFSQAGVTGADFTNADLSGAALSVNMTNAQMLSAASLHGANFWSYWSGWSNKDFSNLDLTNGVFIGTNLYGTNFSGAILRDADLGADVSGSRSDDATYSNFSGADLDSAQIEWRDFNGANFQNAQLTNITASMGAKFWNVDFRNANLSNSDFSDVWSCDGANLSGANLTNTAILLDVLSGWSFTDFSDANISGVTFSGLGGGSAVDYGNTWTGSYYYTDNEPSWGAGMDAAWRTSVGILALAPTSAVPEPRAILLALLGLALLPRRRRR